MIFASCAADTFDLEVFRHNHVDLIYFESKVCSLKVGIFAFLTADLGTLLRRQVEGVANFSVLGQFHGFFYELIIDFVMHEDATPGCTRLAIVPEQSIVDCVQCGLHIRIFTDNYRIVAAELQGHSFNVISGDLLDQLTLLMAFGVTPSRIPPHIKIVRVHIQNARSYRWNRSRERHFVDERMRDQSTSCRLTIPADNIHDAIGKTGLGRTNV